MKQPNRYTIYRVNAFEWLKKRRAKTVHAIVTDPPYAIIEYSKEELRKRKNGKGGIWRLPPNYDGHQRSPMPRFTVLTENQIAEVKKFHGQLAPLLFKVLVPGGHVILATQNLLLHLVIAEFLEAGFELRGQVARIVKTLRGGDRPKGAHRKYSQLSVVPRSSWEPWLVFRKPCEGRVRDNLLKWKAGALRRPSKDAPFRDLIQSGVAPRVERDIACHPSLKPQAFIRQIVRAVLPFETGVILDPFMGSGSAIAAAEQQGLRSVGLEMSPEYFAMAQRAIPQLAKIRVQNHRNGN
ncbi:MAG: site-specific DNA-methyltransferase [Verrucomicrobia bacterium]|nr:site-specific DNA-methyltransferase [Verrucomicrobiota bacterium]